MSCVSLLDLGMHREGVGIAVIADIAVIAGIAGIGKQNS